ncbi:MAG: enoyl-CoA hydratase-related protein [bacterium]
MADQLLFDVQNGIATITLNRPEKLNAFTSEMLAAWTDAYRQCRDRDDIRVAILTGAGRGFCSGGDVSRMGDAEKVTPLWMKNDLWSTIQTLALTAAEVDKPLICAVNGAATGAGMDVTLMCDLRIAAESARFAESYVKLGLVPGGGGCWFLPRLIGPTKAAELLLTGDFVDAREALRIGLVSEVVPDAQLMEKAHQLAGRIARNPLHSIRLIKRAMQQGRNIDLRTHLDQVSSHIAVARATEDHAEAVAAFREKREPVFKGK